MRAARGEGPVLFALFWRSETVKGVRENMRKSVEKAYAINDVKAVFVSLVDKAANRKTLLITKGDDGSASIQTYGRIIKSDATAHYVTGVVYEPMAEDTQGNYMTEEEITKAAYWFMKNGSGVDLQHNFEPLEGATVVESYVTKCDEEIEGEPVKKGTWLMTMEITNPDIFAAIEKGEITGFSMGGTGVYSTEDVDISGAEGAEPVEKDEESRKKSVIKQLTGLLWPGTVKKGAVKEAYKKNSVRDNFWTAFYALNDNLLSCYNPTTGNWEIQRDESAIREALQDFNEIITSLLTDENGVFKSLNANYAGSVEKAGKAMSGENMKALKGIHESLGAFLSKFEEEEEIEVTKSELETIVTKAVGTAVDAAVEKMGGNAGQPQPGEKAGEVEKAGAEQSEPVTQEAIQKMVDAAIQKAMQPAGEKQPTVDEINEMIEKAVTKAMEPVLKDAGLPTHVGDDEPLEKGAGEEHYLHGIL